MSPSELIDVIDPRAAVSRGLAVLTFRLTYFRGGGMCLGVSRHHAIGDLHSYMCLMRAWTAAVAGLEFERPLIVEDRDAFLAAELPPPGNQPVGLRHLSVLDLARLGVYKAFQARRRAPVHFYFTPGELLNMQKEQREVVGERLSKNDVLTAHMFSLIEQRDKHKRPRQLAVTVNYRQRAGLPTMLLGNMVSRINLRCDPGMPSTSVARELRHAVDNYATDHLNYLSNVAFVLGRGGRKRIRRFIPAGLDPLKGNLMVTNWSKSGVYDVEFDGQTPFLYLHAGEAPFPWLSAIVEGPNGDGRIYMGMLPTPIARALTSEEGLSAIHAYRESAQDLSPRFDRLPWLN